MVSKRNGTHLNSDSCRPMSKVDWQRVTAEKNAHRDKLAARPFNEKLLMLERLRERTQAIASGNLSAGGRVAASGAKPSQTQRVSTGAATAVAAGFFGTAAT